MKVGQKRREKRKGEEQAIKIHIQFVTKVLGVKNGESKKERERER